MNKLKIEKYIPKNRRNINGDWVKEEPVWVVYKKCLWGLLKKYVDFDTYAYNKEWEEYKYMELVRVVFSKNVKEAQFFTTESNAQEFLDDVANNPDKYVMAK